MAFIASKAIAATSAFAFGICLVNVMFGSWWNIRVLESVETTNLKRWTANTEHFTDNENAFVYTSPSVWPENIDDQLLWVHYGIQNALLLNRTFVIPDIMGKSFEMYFQAKKLDGFVKSINYYDFLFECENEIDILYFQHGDEVLELKKKSFSSRFKRIHHFLEASADNLFLKVPKCTVLNFFLGNFGNFSQTFRGYNVSSNSEFKRVFSTIHASRHIKYAITKYSEFEKIKGKRTLCVEIPTRKVLKCSKHFSACLPDVEMINCIRRISPEIAYLAIESPQDRTKVQRHFQKRLPSTRFIFLNESFMDIVKEFPGMHSIAEQELCSETDYFVGNPWSSWSGSVFNRRMVNGLNNSLKWWQCTSRPFSGNSYN
jgi:hypothetical protein